MLALAQPGNAIAANQNATQADFEKLQEQVRALDKELAVQREAFVRKLDDVEKRQTENTAKDANSLTAISNQTTTLGNYISYTSAAITVFVFVAGLVTYFSATSKAEKEARAASKQWFDQNATELKVEIEKLRADAAGQVQANVDKVSAQAEATVSEMHREAEARRNLLSSIAKTDGSGGVADEANQQAAAIVRNTNETLKTKPESTFTASDFFARGLSLLQDENFQSALTAFDQAIKLADSKTKADPEQVSQYLFAKGVTLGQLDKPLDAIAVYDELDRRFGADTTPAVREQVAKGLVSKGVRFGQLDKLLDAIAVCDELDRRFSADTTPAVREQVAKGLFSKGATLGKLDKPLDAIAVYDELDRRFGADTTPAVRNQVAMGLVNKGFTLGHLDKPLDAIAFYDELDRRFGADTTPAVRELVARGANSAGFSRIMLAKQNWATGALRLEHLNGAIAGLKRAERQCSKDDRAMVLGNLGYGLFLAEDLPAAEIATLECLQLGGQKALDAQLADAKLHRVEPEDSQYEAMLAKLWATLPQANNAS